jgi:hypothetical protein
MASCPKCKNEIPTRIGTERGWVAVSSNRKFCFDCSPKGSHNTRNLSESGGACKRCGNPNKTRQGNPSPSDALCSSCRVTLWRQKMKLKAVDYKGGNCVSCGFNKYTAALEFHHSDPKQKDFGFSGKTVSWDRMKKELDKCLLLCSNCHRAVHSGELEQ